MKKIAKLSIINKVLLGQCLIISIMMVVFLLLGDFIRFKSAVYGGIAVFLPNFYFARKINSQAGQEAKKIVQSFYAGESGKLIMTAIIFACIFQDPHIDFIAMLITYISALTVFWFALLIRKY